MQRTKVLTQTSMNGDYGRQLSCIFAIKVCAYSIISNAFELVLHAN